MTRTKTLIIGVLVLSLLAFGIVAIAANGFGKGGQTDQARAGAGSYLQQRDSDGDGIMNCDDPDWTRPLDGSGYEAMNGSCAQDGTGQGLHHGMGNGAHDGSGQAGQRGYGSGACGK